MRYTFVTTARGDIILPSTVDLVFMPGAYLTVPPGVTLHILGRVEAADMPVFCTPGEMAAGGFPMATAMGGEVRLLSPRQRSLNLRWFGAMPVPDNEQVDAPHFDSAFALQAALRCASVARVQFPNTGLGFSTPGQERLLSPLTILASGGNYRLRRKVEVTRGIFAAYWGDRHPKVVLRGTAFGGGEGPPATFTYRRPDNETIPPEALDALTLGAGIDLDMEGVQWRALAPLRNVLAIRAEGAVMPQRVRIQDCAFRGGAEACISVEEGPTNRQTLVTLRRVSFSPYMEGLNLLSRSALCVRGSTKVLVHLSQTRVATEEIALLEGLGDECCLRLQGGSCLYESSFPHTGFGPRPTPVLPAGPNLPRGSVDFVRSGRPAGKGYVNLARTPEARQNLTVADGQDVFLEAPGREGGAWAHLSMIMIESESWSLLASENREVARAIKHPILLQGVMANNVNITESSSPLTYFKFRAELELNRSRNNWMPTAGGANPADHSPLSIVMGGNPGPLVLVGCRLFGATALGREAKAYDAGVAYKDLGPLNGAIAYVSLAYVQARTGTLGFPSAGIPWRTLTPNDADVRFNAVPRLDLVRVADGFEGNAGQR